jgi:DNA-3-methyladenine glycosylase
MVLPLSFYQQEDVLSISKQLLGKVICSNIDECFVSGIICETEAYAGVKDKASHAYGNRRTARTEVMYSSGGYSYVYLCYGIHHLLNVVTNHQDVPHAILIRGIFPLEGKKIIQQRRKLKALSKNSCIGPGKVSQALGVTLSHNRQTYTKKNKLWIEDRSIEVDEQKILVGPRVGVDYAGEDASLPYRFQYAHF